MAKPIKITILGDASHLDRTIQGVQGTLGGLTGGLGRLAGAMAGAFAATQVVQFGRDAIGAASDLNETVSMVDTVFGQSAQTIQAWSQGSAAAFGQSRQQALQAAGTFGNLFTQLGLSTDNAAGLSTQMVELASDFASFHNASPPDVIDAMTAAFRGEYDAVQRFVPTINAAAVEAKAMAMGLAATTGELDAQDKALATQALLMEGAGAAMGDFARTSDGAANQGRILSAQFEDLKARVGQALLPAFAAVVSFTSDRVIPVLENLADYLKDDVAPIASRVFDTFRAKVQEWWPVVQEAVGTVVRIVQDLVARFRTGASDVEGAGNRLGEIARRLREVFSSALGAIQVVVQTVLRVVTDLWRRWGEDVVNFLTQTWQNVQQVLDGALQLLTGVFDLIKAILTGKWGEAWEAIKAILSGAWDVIQGIVRTAVETLRLAITGALAAISAAWSFAWNGLKTLLSDIWGGIRSTVSSGIDGVMGFIGGIPGRIRSFIGGVSAAAAELGSSILSGIGNGIRSFGGFVSDIGAAVRDAVKGAINTVIDALNDGIPNSLGSGFLSIDLPDNPIPRLRAMGGPSAGWTMVGERGPEPVFLPKGSHVVPNHAAGSLGASITINVAQTGASARDIASEVAWAFKTAGR